MIERILTVGGLTLVSRLTGFVRDISSDENDEAITSAIIAMGHSLRLTLIAEGVETEEQLAFLRVRECHKVQGYLFGRPMPAANLQALLADKR